MKFRDGFHIVAAAMAGLGAAQGLAAAAPGTRLSFRVLSVQAETPPPFAAVEFIYGPKETIRRRSKGGPADGQWWQLEIYSNPATGSPPQCVVRGLTSTDPLAGSRSLPFYRYQLRMPGTGEALEYVDVHSGLALLPAWENFEQRFVPSAAETSRRQDGAPQTCHFLGQVLSLRQLGHDGSWSNWPDVKRLELDREVLVGTGRNFKDVEGRRLPQSTPPRDYTYTNFTGSDYRTMIDAGMNLFTIAPEQEPWVRCEPVFYLRSAAGPPSLRYPADLYRANYLGPAMFLDEPASILTWDKYAAGVITHFSDVAVLIEERTRATFDSECPHYGRFWLGQQLRSLGVHLGDWRVGQLELPIWETQYDTTFYEVKGGGSGIVHEGRYQLNQFDDLMARFTGERRPHTARQMLQWYYAFLRGGTRPFGKGWGTAIYGQCDPAIAPQAFATAYEMGARYFWFWTSDRGHHVPWPEQLALARSLQAYAREHPRASIYAPRPKSDKLILLPQGTFATYAKPGWFPGLDAPGNHAESQAYQRVQRRLGNAVEQCYRQGEDFDIAIDDARTVKGYRQVVRLSEKE